jgi:hypothetical protein
MIGTMIAEITRGIRADDVRSRLAGGRDHARDQMIRSRVPLMAFRWSHVARATATITAPMAMNQVRLKRH